MLVGISGAPQSGRKTAIEYFQTKNFELITLEDVENIVHKWRENFVVLLDGVPPPSLVKRPWFVHVHLERFNKSNLRDRVLNIRNAHVVILNDFATINEFHSELECVDVLNKERIRPSWDSYFMTMADLAAQRSNCMKRRVGCVLVSDYRVIATGYNGTPRGVLNCNDGGCPRCNSGSKGGTLLSTCLCLHAEENALLEAGRQRSINSTLYCNTCPCLTCSSKIVQVGVKEVVYSQEYSMDGESKKLLENGGVKLRRYTALENSVRV